MSEIEMIVANYLSAERMAKVLGRDFDDFAKAGRVHDWRNHIPEPIKPEWSTLPIEARALAWAMAHEAASAEEWE